MRARLRPSRGIQVVQVTLTAVALPTLAPTPKLARPQRCDWCAGKFDRAGNCKRCKRPA